MIPGLYQDASVAASAAAINTALGNGGTLYQPYLVKSVESYEGQVLEETQPKALSTTTLKDKTVVVGVSGGIAAYKSADLVRRLIERGAQVQVVTCTLGEEGEVIGDQWAQLGVEHADQLGGYRIGEP